MDNQPPSGLDRFRGWTLTALYSSLALLSVMLLYALILISKQLDASLLSLYGMGIACIASAVFNSLAAVRHFQCVRHGHALPRLALKPFLFMAIALTFAGQIFQNL